MNIPRYGLKKTALWLLGLCLLVSSVSAGEVTFAEPRALGERGRELCIGDFDNDGDPDLGVEKNGQYRYLYKHDGRKSPGYASEHLWENPNPSPFGDDPPKNHYAVDINGDGIDDWLTCPPSGGGMFLQLSSGKKPVTFERSSVSYGRYISAGAPGDLDGDGKMDIAVYFQTPDPGELMLAWFQNTGKDEPRFIEVPIDSVRCLNLGGRVHVADLNGDGANDVILSYRGNAYWYENDGQTQPGFTKHEFTDGSDYFSGRIATADLNGDGHPDIVIGNKYLISDGEKIPQFQVGEYWDTSVSYAYVATGDLDGDGDVDIIGYPPGVSSVVWYENDGGVFPSFTWHIMHRLETDYDDAKFYDVKMVDIDQDGDLDVIMAYTVDTEPYRHKEQVFLFENLLKSPKDVGLFTPRKGDQFHVDQFMAVKWRSELDTSGPSVRFELHQGETDSKISDLGQDMSEEGQGCFHTPVPLHLPTGDDYRIRIISLLDEQYTAFSEAFTIIGNTAVAPGHFEFYE